MADGYLKNPDYWRARAEEARTQAEQMSDARAKSMLLGIAQNYDQLAEQAQAMVQAKKPST